MPALKRADLGEPCAEGQHRQGREHEHRGGGRFGEREAVFLQPDRPVAQRQGLAHPVPFVGPGAVGAQGRNALLEFGEHAFRLVALPMPCRGGIEAQEGAAGADHGADGQNRGQCRRRDASP